MRKLLFVAVTVLAAVVALPAIAASPKRALALDAVQFWNGGFVIEGSTPFDYPLEVTSGGARLRVAIDTPSREDTFLLEIIDPQGAVQASADNSNQFNDEAFVEKPVGGTWLVRVTPGGATRASFRLRAKLERTVASMPDGRVAMLPNLRTVPPYELTFVAPANPLNGVYPPDTVNPPLDIAGVHPVSCTADEAAPVEAGGGGAKRCLRLTSGPINVGDGPFDMRFRFCPADQLFGEWERFVQQPSGYFGEGDSPTGNCFSPDDGFIGLTVGWGDVYRWQRPGQYVEFGTNTDGLYVVRSTVDKGNQVLETDDTDNSAYALVRITGETITPIERGWGLSHLDPNKIVFSGAGPAQRHS